MSLENLYQLSDTLMNFTKKMLKNIWAGTLISLGFYIKIIIIYYKGRFYDIPCSWFLSRNVLLKIFIWFYTTKKKIGACPVWELYTHKHTCTQPFHASINVYVCNLFTEPSLMLHTQSYTHLLSFMHSCILKLTPFIIFITNKLTQYQYSSIKQYHSLWKNRAYFPHFHLYS